MKIGDLWANGTPLRISFAKFGNPQKAELYRSANQRGQVLGLMHAISKSFTDTEAGNSEMVAAQKKVSETSELRRALEDEVLSRLRSGELIGIGYDESGNVVTGRKGASFFKFLITGVPAHSGGQHQKGISAIGELAAKITELHKLTDYELGTTVNVGIVSGGNAINMVAPFAKAEVDVRFKTMEARDNVWDRITTILNTAYIPGTSCEVIESRGFLPLTQSPESKNIFDIYTQAGADLGITIGGEFTGGSADSGFTAQVGAPTVCATGPVGGRAHTPEEFMRIDTMVPRAKTVALAIMRLRA